MPVYEERLLLHRPNEKCMYQPMIGRTQDKAIKQENVDQTEEGE